MAYELFIFDPTGAPSTYRAFMAWFEAQTEFKETHGYDDPGVCTSKLRSFYTAFSEEFPPAYVAGITKPEDDAGEPDYVFGCEMIFAMLGWTDAQRAYEYLNKTASKFGVGYFEVSSHKFQIGNYAPDVSLPDGRVIVEDDVAAKSRGNREIRNPFWLKGLIRHVNTGIRILRGGIEVTLRGTATSYPWHELAVKHHKIVGYYEIRQRAGPILAVYAALPSGFAYSQEISELARIVDSVDANP